MQKTFTKFCSIRYNTTCYFVTSWRKDATRAPESFISLQNSSQVVVVYYSKFLCLIVVCLFKYLCKILYMYIFFEMIFIFKIFIIIVVDTIQFIKIIAYLNELCRK